MFEISITILLIPFAAYLLGSILRVAPREIIWRNGRAQSRQRQHRRDQRRARRGAVGGNSHAGLRHAKGAAAVWLGGRVTNESATWMTIVAFAVLLDIASRYG